MMVPASCSCLCVLVVLRKDTCVVFHTDWTTFLSPPVIPHSWITLRMYAKVGTFCTQVIRVHLFLVGSDVKRRSGVQTILCSQGFELPVLSTGSCFRPLSSVDCYTSL
jgi:hypothetical protein